MSDIYLLQNQDKLFLGKQKDWLDGRDRNSLFKTVHKDEAVNQCVEVSAKDYLQRITLLSCPVDERGLPVIAPDDLPPAQPRPVKQVQAEGQETAQRDLNHDALPLAEPSLSTVEE